MKGCGVLEVILVSAEDLKHAHLLGSSKYFVVLQCGGQVLTSKITKEEDEKVWWNEKFTFKLSSSGRKDMAKLKLSLMEKDKFQEDLFVGDALVHLTGLLREGNQKGFLELMPVPYNVVLKDGTYKGEVKVGLKFISPVDMQNQWRGGYWNMFQGQTQSIYRAILDFTIPRIPWAKFLFHPGRATTHPNSEKE